MNDHDDNTCPASQTAAPKVSLTVLPHSGKLDQLRRENEASGGLPRLQTKAAMSEQIPSLSGAADVPSSSSTPESGALASTAPDQFSPAIRKKLLEAKIIQVLRKIYDPEIPLDIYELGLIYDIDIRDDDSVKVRMTLTAPACPVAGSLPGQVEQQIESIPEVKSAEVVLVWDPPWSRDRMSEAALLQLGML